MSHRGKAFLACFFTVVLGSIAGAQIGILLILWGASSQTLDGFGLAIFGVLLTILALIISAITTAVVWARRKRARGDPHSKVAAGALCLYLGILIGTLLLGWGTLRYFSGPPGPHGAFTEIFEPFDAAGSVAK
jgi:uncharacterized membrane protein YfcA